MRTLIFITLLFFSLKGSTQNNLTNGRQVYPSENHANLDSIQKRSQNVRIVFWNVENLYDPYDDSTKLDDEFTSGGMKRWTYSRFRQKLNHLAKSLLAIGRWEPPAAVGLCEVENRYVLNKLIYDSPLKPFKYKYIHHESPDLRGVDVALLYRPDKMKILANRSISIRFPFDTLSQTREILMVKGILFDQDTIHLLINHWPSRRGGTLASQPRRNYVAGVLRQLVDSIQAHGSGQTVVIMGDFNDEPDSESITGHLLARCDTSGMKTLDLVNLMFPKMKKEGTHKYQGQWAMLDQFMVTANLFLGTQNLRADYSMVHICREAFLLQEDTRFFGDKPLRTYTGPKYTGGFSDHLPVYLDIRCKVQVTNDK